MRIAVISDLHDNVTAWERIAAFLAEQSIETLINCGDTCAPAMLKAMAGSFAGRIHTVYGNVADRELEKKVATALTNVTHYGDKGELVLAEKHVFFNHFPKVAEEAAASGNYDLVCHGHTHLKRWEPSASRSAPALGKTSQACMILNPGTAGGMFQYPSFAIIDLVTMTCNFEEVTL